MSTGEVFLNTCSAWLRRPHSTIALNWNHTHIQKVKFIIFLVGKNYFHNEECWKQHTRICWPLSTITPNWNHTHKRKVKFIIFLVGKNYFHNEESWKQHTKICCSLIHHQPPHFFQDLSPKHSPDFGGVFGGRPQCPGVSRPSERWPDAPETPSRYPPWPCTLVWSTTSIPAGHPTKG